MSETILHIDASARTEGSVSRQLTAEIIAQFSGARVIRRDLKDPIPQISETWVGANFTAQDDRDALQRDTLALSDALIAEIKEADVLVIGVPIYNFGVPAALKAWIDQVARAGVTFKYTPEGPKGLLQGKRAILAFASGGTQVGSDIDFASGYLRHIMGFIGITDVQIVAADRLMVDADAAMKSAQDAIAAVAAKSP